MKHPVFIQVHIPGSCTWRSARADGSSHQCNDQQGRRGRYTFLKKDTVEVQKAFEKNIS